MNQIARLLAAGLGVFLTMGCVPKSSPQERSGITVSYPLDNTCFPPEIVAPTMRWQESRPGADRWRITVRTAHAEEVLPAVVTTRSMWRPDSTQWEQIKNASRSQPATVSIRGFNNSKPRRMLSGGQVSIVTSTDSVGAPIFYREVILPFEEAVRDPAQIRWRFGVVSSTAQPPVVLQKLPVCGNCHSFCANGTVLGLEVDSGNDKGAYAVGPVRPEIVLDRSRIISWADYRRDDEDPTFGLLCQVSPDGRYIAGTVKDQALAVYRPNLMFSQIFFLIKGMVAIYDRTTRTYAALPGASDAQFCQSNATWRPDGQELVFARGPGYDLDGFRKQRRALVGGEEAEEFLRNQGATYKYDLFRIPFADGKGGTATPLEGASNNGKSNYFAKYSPDGRWIVFCQAANYMLLQPDSRLFIIPATGGPARPLECNTPMMNSWHSWSPNSRWLVFSSKWNGPYTQLMLSHIDTAGHASPPVVLEQFTSADRAANIPEFVNTHPDSLKVIHEHYLDATSYYRIANEFHKSGMVTRAIAAYREALQWNPRNYFAWNNLGVLLMGRGERDEARSMFEKAIALGIDDAEHFEAHSNLAVCMLKDGEYDAALRELEIAWRLNPCETTRGNLDKARHSIEKERAVP